MTIPSTIAEYLSRFSPELGDEFCFVLPRAPGPRRSSVGKVRHLGEHPLLPSVWRRWESLSAGNDASGRSSCRMRDRQDAHGAFRNPCALGRQAVCRPGHGAAKHCREVVPGGPDYHPRSACLPG